VFHHFTACDSPFDLHLIIKLVSAKRFDGITGVFVIKELIDLYPEFKIHAAMFDKAYDAIGFYRLLTSYHIAPVIDISKRHSQALPLPKGFDKIRLVCYALFQGSVLLTSIFNHYFDCFVSFVIFLHNCFRVHLNKSFFMSVLQNLHMLLLIYNSIIF